MCPQDEIVGASKTQDAGFDSRCGLQVKRGELSNLRMVAGNEKKYSIVILDGTVKEWVGIGWIDLREATDADRKKYPTVVD